MRIGIRTDSLRKVYTSPPPVAGQGRGFGFGGRRPKTKTKSTYQVVALDGLTVRVNA